MLGKRARISQCFGLFSASTGVTTWMEYDASSSGSMLDAFASWVYQWSRGEWVVVHRETAHTMAEFLQHHWPATNRAGIAVSHYQLQTAMLTYHARPCHWTEGVCDLHRVSDEIFRFEENEWPDHYVDPDAVCRAALYLSLFGTNSEFYHYIQRYRQHPYMLERIQATCVPPPTPPPEPRGSKRSAEVDADETRRSRLCVVSEDMICQ